MPITTIPQAVNRLAIRTTSIVSYLDRLRCDNGDTECLLLYRIVVINGNEMNSWYHVTCQAAGIRYQFGKSGVTDIINPTMLNQGLYMTQSAIIFSKRHRLLCLHSTKFTFSLLIQKPTYDDDNRLFFSNVGIRTSFLPEWVPRSKIINQSMP